MANPRNLGDHQVFREDFLNAQAVVDNGGVLASGATISGGNAVLDGVTGDVSYLSPNTNVGPESFTLRLRLSVVDNASTDAIISRRNNFTSGAAGYTLFMDSSGNVRASVCDGTTLVTSASTDAFVVSDNVFFEVVVSCEFGGNMNVYVNGAVTSAAISVAAVTSFSVDTDFSVGALSGGGATNTEGSYDFVELYKGTAWTLAEALDAFENDTYEEVDAGKAVLYLPLRSRFDDGSNEVTSNIGSVGTNPVVGDGSTSTTFPTQVLPHGNNFDGGDWLNAGDNASYDFANGENFSYTFGLKDIVDDGIAQTVLVKVASGFALTGQANATGLDVLIRADTNGLLNFRVKDDSDNSVAMVGTTDVAKGGQAYHVACVCNWTDLRLYVNGVLEGTPVSVSAITGTLANNGNLVFGISGILSGNAYNGALFTPALHREALTPRQIRWLSERFYKELNT